MDKAKVFRDMKAYYQDMIDQCDKVINKIEQCGEIDQQLYNETMDKAFNYAAILGGKTWH